MLLLTLWGAFCDVGSGWKYVALAGGAPVTVIPEAGDKDLLALFELFDDGRATPRLTWLDWSCDINSVTLCKFFPAIDLSLTDKRTSPCLSPASDADDSEQTY